MRPIHSSLTERTKRCAYAFRFGNRGGSRVTSIMQSLSTASVDSLVALPYGDDRYSHEDDDRQSPLYPVSVSATPDFLFPACGRSLMTCRVSFHSSKTPDYCRNAAIGSSRKIPPHAFTSEIPACSAFSSTYQSERPSAPRSSRLSFPSATMVPTPVLVKNAGIPAPPARNFSASVPWGVNFQLSRQVLTFELLGSH